MEILGGRAPLFAVLTGDLIGSTELDVEGFARARLTAESASARLKEAYPLAGVGQVDLFRGDAWQLAVASPAFALRAALLIRADLRALADIDTRIAVGIGRVEHLDPGRVSRSTGEAFTLSGRALDRMTSYFDLTGAAPKSFAAAPWFTLSLQLCGGLARGWTRRQAEVVSQALLMTAPTHEAIAQAFQVRKQSITGVLEAAHWRLLSEALKVFETADWGAVGEPG